MMIWWKHLTWVGYVSWSIIKWSGLDWGEETTSRLEVVNQPLLPPSGQTGAAWWAHVFHLLFLGTLSGYQVHTEFPSKVWRNEKMTQSVLFMGHRGETVSQDQWISQETGTKSDFIFTNHQKKEVFLEVSDPSEGRQLTSVMTDFSTWGLGGVKVEQSQRQTSLSSLE